MRVGLRTRLLFPLAVVLAADAVATGWAAWSAAAHTDRRIAAQLRAVGRTLTEPPTFPLTQRVLEQMKGLSGAEFLLVRPDGTRLSTLADPPPSLPDLPAPAPADAEPTLGPPVTIRATEYRGLRLPLAPPHPNEGGTLLVFYPEALRQTAILDAVVPYLLLGGLGGLLAVGLTLAVAGRLVNRIGELNRRTGAIAAGDFRPMPLPGQDDELRDLCRAVNDMAVRLAAFRDELAAAERLKLLGQFSGGLAHQLRNAAAGARLAVQIHRKECPAAEGETLAVALRQLDRIETNLRQFLDLGKPPKPANEPCDLGELVTQAVELLAPQARHAGTTLTWEPPAEPARITGDGTLLGHLVLNLVGNAVEAAGPGGTVEVSLRAATAGERPAYAIEVSDTGPGPPPELADRLFDPFVTGKQQGIGLGLAVARQAAEAHGGRISWKRRGDRTVFRVELPLVSQPGAQATE